MAWDLLEFVIFVLWTGAIIMSYNDNGVDIATGMVKDWAAHMVVAGPAINRARDEGRAEVQAQLAAADADYNRLWNTSEYNFQGWEGAKKQRDLLKSAYEQQKSAYEHAKTAYEQAKTAWEKAVAAWDSEKKRADQNYVAWEFQKNRADVAESQLAEKQVYVEKLEADLRELSGWAKDLLDSNVMQLKFSLALMNLLETAPVRVKEMISQQVEDNGENDAKVLSAKFIAKAQGWQKQIEAAGTQGQAETAVLEEILEDRKEQSWLD
jgi:hypothetical protein